MLRESLRTRDVLRLEAGKRLNGGFPKLEGPLRVPFKGIEMIYIIDVPFIREIPNTKRMRACRSHSSGREREGTHSDSKCHAGIDHSGGGPALCLHAFACKPQ